MVDCPHQTAITFESKPDLITAPPDRNTRVLIEGDCLLDDRQIKRGFFRLHFYLHTTLSNWNERIYAHPENQFNLTKSLQNIIFLKKQKTGNKNYGNKKIIPDDKNQTLTIHDGKN